MLKRRSEVILMAKIYIKVISNKLNFNWKNAEELPFVSYDIDEGDYREKSASIKTVQHLDLSAGTYIVLIVGHHENFAGVILTEDYDAANNTYTYKCKDFHVLYRDKFTKTYKKATGRRILTDLLTFNKIGELKINKKAKKDKVTGYPRKHLEKFSRQLNGMRANSKYEMKNYGASKAFNPLTKQYKNQKLENKTLYEFIKSYTIGTGAFLDLYINDYGTLVIEPFDIDYWRKPKYLISDVYNNMKFKSSTENIVTDVTLKGKNYTTKKISKYDLNDIFIGNVSSITENSTSGKKDNKTQQTSNSSHPYVCKNKEIWINMDLWTNYSNDKTWLGKVCKELKKLGWKVHNMGVGPSIHTDKSKFSQAKNGLWVTIDNGVDPAVLRELANSDWCAGAIAKNGSVPCLFFVGEHKAKFTKGGPGYTHIGVAHDDNGNGVALDYPAGYLAECGVPFAFCGNTPREVAEKINNGGDSTIACKTNFINRKKTGYAKNWSWSHDY
jgi:hypothetical protein